MLDSILKPVIWFAINQVAGFYMECNTGLKCVKLNACFLFLFEGCIKPTFYVFKKLDFIVKHNEQFGQLI